MILYEECTIDECMMDLAFGGKGYALYCIVAFGSSRYVD